MKFRSVKPSPEPSLRQRQHSLRSGGPQMYSYRSMRSEPPATPGGGRRRGEAGDTPRRPSMSAVLRFWGQRIGFLAAGLAIIISAIVIVQITPNPKIVVLSSASGGSLQDPSVYQQAAAKLFASSFANRNKITANTAAISQKLEAEFPELQAVSVTLPLVGHRPIVYIQPSPLSLIVAEDNGQTYVVDASGHAIGLATSTMAAKFPVIQDHSNLQPKVGSAILASSSVIFIDTVLYEIQQYHISLGTVSLPAAADELDVAVRGQPFYVKFNLQDSGTARQQAGTFLAVWHQLQQQHVTPGHYIDVRIAGRAYYK